MLNLDKNKRLSLRSSKNMRFLYKNIKNNFIYGNSIGTLSTTKPFEDINSIVYGLFDASEFIHQLCKKDLFIIPFTDRCRIFSIFFFTSKATSQDFIKAFKSEWLSIFKKLKTFLSDNAKCYTSYSTIQHFKS
ncbi:hypothetical protein DMUE_3372 [Dictyocoela muelleri]|nr:hypothetical protein DMUE_3372 [Dictyocoela muelleri]